MKATCHSSSLQLGAKRAVQIHRHNTCVYERGLTGKIPNHQASKKNGKLNQDFVRPKTSKGQEKIVEKGRNKAWTGK